MNGLIAILNKSTLVSNADVASWTQACAHQIQYHVAPKWHMTPKAVVFYSSEADVPAAAWRIFVLDDPDQAGALGYHDMTPDGKPYGRIFVRPCQQYGVAPSTTLSHEVIEAFLDPFCNLWADSNQGYSIAVEGCDPVESNSYVIGGVAVSDFVLPAYFNPLAPTGSRFNWLASLRAPFTLDTGGYLIRMVDGKVSQEFAQEYPDWKRELKAYGSRTSRR